MLSNNCTITYFSNFVNMMDSADETQEVEKSPVEEGEVVEETRPVWFAMTSASY